MVIAKICKMSIKGVKLKSESFFSISPGVLELWRKNLRGADSAPPGPDRVKLQLHYAIYLLRFYSNSLIHILSLSNSHNNVASIQKNRGDKSHRVIVALSYNYTIRFIGYDSIQGR